MQRKAQARETALRIGEGGGIRFLHVSKGFFSQSSLLPVVCADSAVTAHSEVSHSNSR